MCIWNPIMHQLIHHHALQLDDFLSMQYIKASYMNSIYSIDATSPVSNSSALVASS